MKKFIIILIILALVGAVLWFLFGQGQIPITNQSLPTSGSITNQSPGQEEQNIQEVASLSDQELKLKELMAKARNFIERYGSFSTDAQFANLYDLKNEMTDNFWRETEKYIEANKEKENLGFYGITSKVLNIVEGKFSDNYVKYLVFLQRDETKNQEREVFYQNAEIELIKKGEVWLIDSVVWQ